MNTSNNPNRLHLVPQSSASAFCGGLSRRSGDMRSVILSGDAAHISQALQESIDRTFGIISHETQPETDNRT
jgi:hypothetical protein